MIRTILLLLLPVIAVAQVEIVGGHIYLEIDGERIESPYYTQIYKAQEAAINLSIQRQSDVRILLPAQTVSYVGFEIPVTIYWDAATTREDGSVFTPESYEVQVMLEGGTTLLREVAGTENSLVLSLTPGTYRAAIAAVDAQGLRGEWSEIATLELTR